MEARDAHGPFKEKAVSAQRSPSDLNIGGRLREIRLARRLSQRELARQSGVTNALISQIEQNHSSPSVASLKRILDAVPMSLAEFFSDSDGSGDPSKVFFSASELREINPLKIFHKGTDIKGISLRQVGDSSERRIQMMHETYPPGADTGAELYAHEAEEAGIVVSGRIEVTVGSETRELKAGDGYIFDSRIPHRFHNRSDAACIIVSACTPPSF
ncbi:cupin domain-containing protein [Pseudotabrizicola sp. L79]|uniref:cupin domain-containing protein n=1 Tax=Pseudotabrizicola sp. L79 TaxID=3118402 RepID=UPI002F92C5FC